MVFSKLRNFLATSYRKGKRFKRVVKKHDALFYEQRCYYDAVITSR
jgi:hypothetical protein